MIGPEFGPEARVLLVVRDTLRLETAVMHQLVVAHNLHRNDPFHAFSRHVFGGRVTRAKLIYRYN